MYLGRRVTIFVIVIRSAEELGIKDLLPPYFDPNLQPNDLLTGVCFASGGSGYDPLTAKMAVRIFSLSFFSFTS